MSKNALVIKGVNFASNKLTTVTFIEDEVPCTGISLDQSSKTVTNLTPFTLVATATPANTTDEVIWSSSDNTTATVSNGTVTVIGVGTVTITATCGSYSASCIVDASEIIVGADFGFFNINKYSDTFVRSADGGSYFTIYDLDSYGTIRGFRVGNNHNGTPIQLINNVEKVKIVIAGMGNYGTSMFWCDTDQAADSSYNDCCLLLYEDTTNTTVQNQTKTFVYDVYSGANAFAFRSRCSGGTQPSGVTADEYADTNGITISLLAGN